MSVGGGRILVVVNAAARGGAAALADEVVERCARYASVARLAPPDAAGAVTAVRAAVAGDGPWRAVVAVGGDGTVRAVAEGVARGLGRFPAGDPAAPRGAYPAPFGLLVAPGGTGNSVYRALWEDRPWPDVFDEVLGAGGRARVRDVDLLRVAETGEAVLLGASAGIVAEIVRASESLRGVDGRQRYEVAAGQALAEHVPFPARVTVDGALLHDGSTTLAIAGGARHRSGVFEFLPRSVLDDGLLDVCVVAGVDAAGFADLAGAIVAGAHVGRPGVAYAQGRAVTIARTDGAALCFEHDGDRRPATGSSVTLEVVPRAVPTLGV